MTQDDHDSSYGSPFEQNPGDRSRRGFLKSAVAAVAGGSVLGAAGSETASAASGDEKAVTVEGLSQGHHTYTVAIGGVDSEISRGQYSKPSEHGDTIDDTAYATAEGHLHDRGRDSYTYTGRVAFVRADGDVRFTFHDWSFEAGEDILVMPIGSDRKRSYSIRVDPGDIDLGGKANSKYDTDEYGFPSEFPSTPDEVSGFLWGGQDDYEYTGLISEIEAHGDEFQFVFL